MSATGLRQALEEAAAAQDAVLGSWHRADPAGFGDDLRDLVLAQHHVNLRQWHAEDHARAPGASAAEVAAAKREIDRLNARRHELTSRIDAAIVALLSAAGVEQSPAAPLASESPASVVDRCSVLAIRRWHCEHSAALPCAPARPCAEVGAMREHRAALVRCLGELVDDVAHGRRRFLPHRAFKSYGARGAGAAAGARGAGAAAGARGTDRVRTILAINFNHDGSAALLRDGELAGYVNTERFSRLKKHPGIRDADLDELLDQAGASLADVDHVVLCNLANMDSPDVVTLHGGDLKETWPPFEVDATGGRVTLRGRSIPCTVNPDHHLLHAAAAFLTSPFDSAVMLVCDPLGCRAFAGRDHRVEPLDWTTASDLQAHVGYGSVAERLFGTSIVGAGKVMGLAPLGRPREPLGVRPEEVASFDALVRLANRDPVLVECDGRPLNATLAYCVQLGLELQLTGMLRELAGLCGRDGIARNLCLAGGTALNAVANEIAYDGSGFGSLHLHPACGDDGTSIGAALWIWHDRLGHPRRPFSAAELMYSRRGYGEDAVRRATEAAGDRLAISAAPDYVERTAELLAGGAVVAWFDGASEVGPRALGHRSILADPRDAQVKERLNRRVKFREFFRPYAPSVLAERGREWLGTDDSPFMLRAPRVRRGGVPAIAHLDGTARAQTVRAADNASYHALIEAFERRTGVPMLLNTSLNARGEPIAETPAHAIETLLSVDLDYVVFPGLILGRADALP